MCHKKKSVIKFLCIGCEGKGNVSREVRAPPSAALFYPLLQTDKCQSVRILSSSPLHSCHLLCNRLAGAAQPIFSTATLSLCQLFDLPLVSEHLSCVGDPVASGANCLRLEVTVIHRRCATSLNNQIPFLAVLTEIGSESTPPPV